MARAGVSRGAAEACSIPNCGAVAETGAPLPLCTRHLLIANDWVQRDVGVTDLLPSPCMACGSRLGVQYPSGWVCAACEWRLGEIPDADLAREPIEIVYYVRLGRQLKIGTTANPKQRFAAIPHDEVLAFERGGRRLERRRHEQFAAARGGTSEWFESTPELEAHVAALREGEPDPWVRYAQWVSRAAALRG